jgi:DNA-binding NarL/FixJ family response regulator
MMEPIRVLIADDHPVVRAGLQGMLLGQPDIQVVGEATTGAEAIALSQKLRPNVVLMDLRMPEMDGVSATVHIREQQPETHVLVLTTYDGDADILRAVEAGATGYLLKDAPRDDLFKAVRAAAAGDSFLATAVANRVMERVRVPPECPLSEREVEVLTLVARGASNKEIGKQLWISDATVKTHLTHIYGKLGVNDRTAAATVALQRGILHLNSESDHLSNRV